MRNVISVRLAGGVFLAFFTGCGSIVESTQEKSPPGHGSEMEGIAYWLPTGSIVLDGTWEKDKDCTIKIGTLIEPDTCSRWRLTRKINHLFDDTVALEVDPATGLLKTVGGTSEDKSAQIIATALETVAKVMTLGAGAPISSATLAGAEGRECAGATPLTPPFHIAIPAKDLHVKYEHCFKITGPPSTPPKQNQDTSGQNEKPEPPVITVKLEVTRKDESTSASGTEIGKNVDGKVMVDGIVVRAPAPYEVKLTQKGRTPTAGADLSGEQIVFLPDPNRIYYLPLDRTPFVKNETKIALVNGVIQSITMTRPSIIYGIVGVPKTILSALVPLTSK